MSEELTVFRVFYDCFMVIWSVIDVMFTAIENWFIFVFSVIPICAIPFLIGIVFYSVLAFVKWCADKSGESRKRLLFKAIIIGFTVFMIMFTVWRLGLIALIPEDQIFLLGLAEFIYNMMYILLGFVLLIVFLRKIPWLKKLLIIFLWGGFLFFTFIIAPFIEDVAFNIDTVFVVFLLGGFFSIPNIMYEYRKMKAKGVD